MAKLFAPIMKSICQHRAFRRCCFYFIPLVSSMAKVIVNKYEWMSELHSSVAKHFKTMSVRARFRIQFELLTNWVKCNHSWRYGKVSIPFGKNALGIEMLVMNFVHVFSFNAQCMYVQPIITNCYLTWSHDISRLIGMRMRACRVARTINC